MVAEKETSRCRTGWLTAAEHNAKAVASRSLHSFHGNLLHYAVSSRWCSQPTLSQHIPKISWTQYEGMLSLISFLDFHHLGGRFGVVSGSVLSIIKYHLIGFSYTNKSNETNAFGSHFSDWRLSISTSSSFPGAIVRQFEFAGVSFRARGFIV